MHVHGSSRQAKWRRTAAKGMTRNTDWVLALPSLDSLLLNLTGTAGGT